MGMISAGTKTDLWLKYVIYRKKKKQKKHSSMSPPSKYGLFWQWIFHIHTKYIIYIHIIIHSDYMNTPKRHHHVIMWSYVSPHWRDPLVISACVKRCCRGFKFNMRLLTSSCLNESGYIIDTNQTLFAILVFLNTSTKNRRTYHHL